MALRLPLGYRLQSAIASGKSIAGAVAGHIFIYRGCVGEPQTAISGISTICHVTVRA